MCLCSILDFFLFGWVYLFVCGIREGNVKYCGSKSQLHKDTPRSVSVSHPFYPSAVPPLLSTHTLSLVSGLFFLCLFCTSGKMHVYIFL